MTPGAEAFGDPSGAARRVEHARVRSELERVDHQRRVGIGVVGLFPRQLDVLPQRRREQVAPPLHRRRLDPRPMTGTRGGGMLVRGAGPTTAPGRERCGSDGRSRSVSRWWRCSSRPPSRRARREIQRTPSHGRGGILPGARRQAEVLRRQQLRARLPRRAGDAHELDVHDLLVASREHVAARLHERRQRLLRQRGRRQRQRRQPVLDAAAVLRHGRSCRLPVDVRGELRGSQRRSPPTGAPRTTGTRSASPTHRSSRRCTRSRTS